MQPSKVIILSWFLLFSFLTNAQQYQLNVRISMQNSRVNNGPIEYVKDAKVSNELSPAKVTDYKGRVELNFMDVGPNSFVNLKVEKEGYEVVNKKVLTNIQILESPSILVFLAKKGELEKIEKDLFKFSLRNIAERKDSIFYLLNLEVASKDNSLEELEKMIGQKKSDKIETKLLLNRYVKDLEKELPDLIHQMVAVNLDFASNRYKKAFELFTKNQLNQAIETLNEEEIDTSFENILASIEQAQETPESYQKILNIRKIQIENVIESFELKKIFLKFAFRFAEAENLSKKIAKMKTLMGHEQQLDILNDQNEREDIVVADQVVNVLLEDTLHLTLIDTHWVELEMEKLISKGIAEDEIIAGPKAKTILETLPGNSEAKILGFDFENTLFVSKIRQPSAIPIYEQSAPVLISAEVIINTNSSVSVETKDEVVWLGFPDVEESKVSAVSKPVSPFKKEGKENFSPPESIVFTEIIEPHYQSYKITKKTSLRQSATAASKVLKRLNVGTEVKVVDQVDPYWCEVILNGEVGYVKVLLLEKSN
jgi:tetratricopeptide (TPR) repeat protein